MKKLTILVLTLSLVGILAFGFTAAASAEDITPVYPGNGGSGNGNGGNGRGGSAAGSGVPLNMNINLDGTLDETMAATIADGLGISVDELKAREDAGETLVAIGISLGFDAQAVLDLHAEARIAALNQAVTDGLITAEQAAWMISRLDNGQFGLYSGTCTADPATCTQMVQQKYQKHMRGGRYASGQ